MMRVHNHGGRCCGIKHIHGFPYNPTDKVAALPVREVHQGASGEMCAPGQDFYPGPRSMETGKERLDDIIKYIDELKTDHLVEVVLGASAATRWQEVLAEHGFVRYVPEFVNSNTTNKLVVFHRITRKGKVVTEKKEK